MTSEDMAVGDLVIDDVPYVIHDGETQLARIYRRPNIEGRNPAIVDVHPGAWLEGDRTWGHVYDEALARRGFVVVAIDFRQAPRFRHPAASADVATAVRWVRSSSRVHTSMPYHLELARIGSLLFIFADSPNDQIGPSSPIDTFATRPSAQPLRLKS